jgi:hypothetical protein
MKIAVFWVVAPCLPDYTALQPSKPTHGLLIALMMEATRTSETLVNFYQTTRRYNPEDSNLQKRVTLKRLHTLKKGEDYNSELYK